MLRVYFPIIAVLASLVILVSAGSYLVTKAKKEVRNEFIIEDNKTIIDAITGRTDAGICLSSDGLYDFETGECEWPRPTSPRD